MQRQNAMELENTNTHAHIDKGKTPIEQWDLIYTWQWGRCVGGRHPLDRPSPLFLLSPLSPLSSTCLASSSPFPFSSLFHFSLSASFTSFHISFSLSTLSPHRFSSPPSSPICVPSSLSFPSPSSPHRPPVSPSSLPRPPITPSLPSPTHLSPDHGWPSSAQTTHPPAHARTHAHPQSGGRPVSSDLIRIHKQENIRVKWRAKWPDAGDGWLGCPKPTSPGN